MIRPEIMSYFSSGGADSNKTEDNRCSRDPLMALLCAPLPKNLSITGTDMSSPFDTINQALLLDTVREIIDGDELRIIGNTSIKSHQSNSHSLPTVAYHKVMDSVPCFFITYVENKVYTTHCSTTNTNFYQMR